MKEANLEINKRLTFLSLFFLGTLVSLQNAWVPGFFADGYLYAAFGKNAALHGDWLVPSLTSESYKEFHHHTPFIFILEGLFFKAFGASFVTARIFTAIFFISCLLLLFKLMASKDLKLSYLCSFLFLSIPPLFKKVRFPNLDIPLMLFLFLGFYFFIEAVSKKEKRYWYFCGFFFGFSLLTKGPVGFLLPIGILFSLLITKRINELRNVAPWLGLFVGFVIFTIWPLSLYLVGKQQVFFNWLDFTFLHTIKDARGSAAPFYTYFIFLLKNAPVWFLLAVFGSYKLVKDGDFLRRSAAIFFWSIFLLFSIASFKYSNYLIPAYPFMAILSGEGLKSLLSEKLQTRFIRSFSLIFAFAAMVILIFPLTNETRRDSEVFQLKAFYENIGFEPKVFYIVDKVYPYWNLNSMNAFENNSILTREITGQEIIDRGSGFCSNCTLFVSNKISQKILGLNNTLGLVAEFPRYHIHVLAPINSIALSPAIKMRR